MKALRNARASRGLPPAFVLGLGENGYGVVRALAAAGVPVVGFYRTVAESGRWSRLCSRQCIDTGIDDEEVCRMLIGHAGRFSTRPVLVPTSDEYARMLANCAGLLSPWFLFHWNEPRLLDTIVDKARMSRACEEAGIAVPATRATVAGEDAEALALSLAYPCVVKPNRSFGLPLPGGRKNFVAQTPRQLSEFFRGQPQLLGNAICQQVVPGGDDRIFQCNVLVDAQGRQVARVSVRKLRQYPAGYGVMCHGRSERNDEVCALAARLLAHLGYRGLASLEFKYAHARPWFIEMNPRLPWYNALFPRTGVDLARLAYFDLVEPAGAHGEPARDGIAWASFKLELAWLLERRGHRAGTWSWFRSLSRASAFAWYQPGDLRPFLHSTWMLVATCLRRLLARIAPAARRQAPGLGADRSMAEGPQPPIALPRMPPDAPLRGAARK